MELRDLTAFVAVVRARGFRGAARGSGQSASKLSEALRRLEAQVGVRLLQRTTRTVVPTEAGARLYERLVPALSEVEAAVDIVNSFRDSPTGTLRLNVPGAVAKMVLPPITEAFMEAHPDIKLEVTVESSLVDVIAGGFDAGIRYGERLEKDMIAVPIGPPTQSYAAAASPDYLARRGTPGHPRDLLGHACIRQRFGNGAMPAWEFEKRGKLVRVDPEARLIITADAADFGISAAIAGLGVVAMFEHWLRPALDAGQLAPVLESWWHEFPGPFLYYPSRRYLPGPLRAFVDFVKRWRAPGHRTPHERT